MMLLLGAIGWGTLTFGALTHALQLERLAELLGRHVGRGVLAARALVAVELALAISIPVGYANHVAWPAWCGAVLGVGFCGWILRLLVSDSDLPCACSFAETPPSVASLARAAAVVAVGALALAGTGQTPSLTVATFAVGLALGAAIFVLPDAVGWPEASRAMMARMEGHQQPMAERS